MADQVLKTVRITDDMKVEVYQQGKKRKYALFYDSNNDYINRRRGDTENTKSEKYDVAMSDDDVIEMALKAYNGRFGGYEKKFYITQKTYSNPAPVRTYGNGDKSPYYINNGCAINIRWVGQIPNPDFVLGTFSSVSAAEKATGIKSYLRDVTITSTIDDATDISKMPSASWGTSFVSYKEVTVSLPKGFTENGGKGHLVWTRDGLQYDSKSLPAGSNGGNSITNFQNQKKDSDIVEHIIASFESDVVFLHGGPLGNIKICAPDNEACSLVPYKSPLEKSPDQVVATQPPGMTQSIPKIKFTIDGLGSEIILKAKQDLDTFTIWTGPIPKPASLSDEFEELDELDDQYKEGVYAGEEEKLAEIESPSSLPEVSSSASSTPETSSVSSYTPDPNAKPGTVVNLPRDYSHTANQGYNILDSKWIGDLIASAKSHIGHPTYDISGTENGNLGCASAVSMMFYRAFGVHMRDGKPVKAKPTDIGSFGTKGTSEAAGWFVNTSLYQKIPWKDAQPGDILNTARNFSTNKAGHIGVVIDVKDKNGSWAVVSNSSKGFAGGGGGAVKQNYSVKAWQSVTDRNPSQTFAFRYIGPRLSQGQTA
jgi:hypothetical protein